LTDSPRSPHTALGLKARTYSRCMDGGLPEVPYIQPRGLEGLAYDQVTGRAVNSEFPSGFTRCLDGAFGSFSSNRRPPWPTLSQPRSSDSTHLLTSTPLRNTTETHHGSQTLRTLALAFDPVAPEEAGTEGRLGHCGSVSHHRHPGAALGTQPAALMTPSQSPVMPVMWPATHDGSNSVTAPPSANGAIELWHHVELLPGLKLLLSSKTSAAVRNVANKICEEFHTADS